MGNGLHGFKPQRGVVLTVAIGTAVVCGVASYAMLMIAYSEAMRGNFYRRNVPARYAAEAGAVWATRRLMRDPTYCGSTAIDPTAGYHDLAINGYTVRVTFSHCETASQTVSSTVEYF